MSQDINKLDNYTLPRGMLFVDPLDANGNTTGELDMGNIVSAGASAEAANLTHESSRGGVLEEDRNIPTKISRGYNVVLDSINMFNMGLFFIGDLSVVNQAATPAVDEVITVQQGRWYQLGGGTDAMGVRNVTGVDVQDVTDVTTHVLDTDYSLDAVNGRIYIIPGGGITDDDVLHVDYTPAAETRNEMASGSTTTNVAIRIVEDNQEGNNKVHYIAKATLSPNGEIPTISSEDAWAQMSYTIGIQKKDVTTPAVRIQDAA